MKEYEKRYLNFTSWTERKEMGCIKFTFQQDLGNDAGRYLEKGYAVRNYVWHGTTGFKSLPWQLPNDCAVSD